MDRKKVLVTGASGFIGSSLVEKLVLMGANVTALVEYNSQGYLYNLNDVEDKILNQVNIVFGDIRDFSLMFNLIKEMDYVYNLAALISIPYSYEASSSYIQTNVIGTQNILEACKNSTVELLIQTSTSEVYGTPNTEFINENHMLNAQSPYAASKIAADQLTHSYYCSYEVPSVIIRPFNTYGPRQSTRALIPSIIRQSLNNNKIFLGNIETTRDYTYIEDTVSGFIHAEKVRKRNAQVFNLGTRTEYSGKEIVEKVANILKKEITVERKNNLIRPNNSEVLRLKSDNSKFVIETGWKPLIDLEEGLNRVVNEIKTNINRKEVFK